jgi:hypothetical protein
MQSNAGGPALRKCLELTSLLCLLLIVANRQHHRLAYGLVSRPVTFRCGKLMQVRVLVVPVTEITCFRRKARPVHRTLWRSACAALACGQQQVLVACCKADRVNYAIFAVVGAQETTGASSCGVTRWRSKSRCRCRLRKMQHASHDTT